MAAMISVAYCESPQDFHGYLKENMNDLGLSAPDQFFDSSGKLVEIASTMAGAIARLGSDATVLEMIRATTGLEKLMVVAALRATYYAGAFIGSAAVAAGRYMSCGSYLVDVISWAQQNSLDTPWFRAIVTRHPEIFDVRMSAARRRTYAIIAHEGTVFGDAA